MVPLPAEPLSAGQLYQLFRDDRLVVHTMPVELAVSKRPQQLSSNTSQLKCGSLFFWGGLQHQDGHLVPNAVARFGDPDHAERTVFATLHDLEAVFETHQQLELKKPPEHKRGAAFVLFSNSDIGNLAKEQPPPDDYMEAVWGECQPVQCERPRGFDFRRYCSTKREKDDPSMEEEQVEWNELRAVLNRDNMVGLLYIHDPKCTPQHHAEEAQQLIKAFDGQYVMAVFKLKEAGGVQGDLLMAEGDDDSSDDLDASKSHDSSERDQGQQQAQGAQSSGSKCRLLTFQEYLMQHQHKHQHWQNV